MQLSSHRQYQRNRQYQQYQQYQQSRQYQQYQQCRQYQYPQYPQYRHPSTRYAAPQPHPGTTAVRPALPLPVLPIRFHRDK
jgi:hypothetical protein